MLSSFRNIHNFYTSTWIYFLWSKIVRQWIINNTVCLRIRLHVILSEGELIFQEQLYKLESCRFPGQGTCNYIWSHFEVVRACKWGNGTDYLHFIQCYWGCIIIDFMMIINHKLCIDINTLFWCLIREYLEINLSFFEEICKVITKTLA